MEYLIANWYVGVVAIALLVGLSIGIYKTIKTPSNTQLKKVKEWLLFAVIEAEKTLGSGVGAVKLAYVYDLFVTRFTWIARLISFELFSVLVDEALETMKDMLKDNKDVRRLIEEPVADKE